ncbi:hypothetical protein FSARC_7792 [Fusarium sarcochroum]|uniref:NmrA-like domain-containing protein n=1 Tax=Fusarium sarcochroum TaxID=1208366 RepID=A0A8H4TUJ5_9HYPO|nr:hypothetical protein FSARC_7792 [Fusarium sarcochroum]
MPKLLTIFGVTGQQGAALARYILDTKSLRSEFTLRGVTRDASKPGAVALKKEGVEIVETDMNIRSSLDKAVVGSNVVFSMTNFWEKCSPEIDVAQGKAIADAAVAAGVSQIIWSSLPSVSLMSGGKVTVEHFETKAEVEEYIRTLNIKCTFFMPGWFMQNHLSILKPEKADDGTYVFSMPWTAVTELPLIDIRDTGKFVAPALLDPDLYHGKRLTCATAFYTLTDMVDTWTRVTGSTVKLRVPENGDKHAGFSEQPKHEGVNATAHINQYGYFGPSGKDNLSWTISRLTEQLTSWEDFVREHQPWFW